MAIPIPDAQLEFLPRSPQRNRCSIVFSFMVERIHPGNLFAVCINYRRRHDKYYPHSPCCRARSRIRLRLQDRLLHKDQSAPAFQPIACPTPAELISDIELKRSVPAPE